VQYAGLVVERTEARTRLQWIVFFRFLIILSCLLALGVRRGSASFVPALALGFWVLVGASILNLVHFAVISAARRPARWGFVQLLMDLLIVSTLIYLSGGVVSYFNVLYFAAILGASSGISGRSGLFSASLSTVLLSIISTTYFVGAYYDLELPLVPEKWIHNVVLDFRFVISYLLAQGIAFHMVAFLALVLELRARRSELLHDALMRDISEGVIALDDRGRFLYMNDEARKMVGLPPLVPVVGKHWDQIFRRAGDKPLRDILFSRQSLRRTVELERGGSKLLVDVKTSLLMDQAHQRMVAVLGDLSLHLRAEEAERRADQLEKVAEMAASMAHELRNPLTSIRSCAQELGSVQPVDEDARRLIEIVCRESDRLDRIISEFLGFARMRPAKLRRGDASSVITEVALLLKKRSKDSPVIVDLDVESALPCLCDQEQLQRALMNIGVNAAEAIENGGRIRISARVLHKTGLLSGDRASGANEGDGGIEITVSDTGQGIAPEDMERIFTPFFTTKKTGTGLGLAIASRIIKAHGGRINVTSELGRGTKFVIWLPLLEETGAAPPQPRT
jgi:PAS domain S-box-containing protein